MNTYPLWQYLHIVLFAYWLGADLGVFFASRYMSRADLVLEERLRYLQLLLTIDMAPRVALILMIPVGFTLATTLGLAPFADGWLPAIWVVALAWLALAWYLSRHSRDPRAAPWVRIDQALRLIVIAGFLGTGLATFVTGGPLLTGWLAGKFVLYAVVVALGLLLRLVIADFIRGFGQVRVEATREAGNALIDDAHRRAARLAILLWLCVAAIAFLGVVKPA